MVKKLSKEWKEKIRQTCIRKGIQPKQRYCGPAWNVGLTGEEYLKHYKRGNVWNAEKFNVQKSVKRGMSYEEFYGIKKAKEIKEKIRQKALQQFKDGMPEETKKKIGIKSLGNKYGLNSIPWNKGLPHKKETIEKIRNTKLKYLKENPQAIEILRQNRAKQVFPKKDTKIEIKIRNFLDQLQIEYFQHKYMNINHGYQCDFFIPSKNLVIECDGTYWHKYPTRRDIDNIRTKELIESGFKVLRLWEFEIIDMNIKDFQKNLHIINV